MRHTFQAALGVLALVAATSVASAEPKQFIIDRSHTEVGFSIRHFFSKVHGEFSDFSGTINFDEKNLANSTVEVTIQDTSIFTGNDRRDNHLRTEDFFWQEKYPTITFKSTKVTPGKEKNHYNVAGNLTIRDVTKPVVLESELLGMGPVAMAGRDMGTRAGFMGKTTINRKDYGIVWNKALDQGGAMLGDDVEITLEVEAFTPSQQAANATPPKPAGDKK